MDTLPDIGMKPYAMGSLVQAKLYMSTEAPFTWQVREAMVCNYDVPADCPEENDPLGVSSKRRNVISDPFYRQSLVQKVRGSGRAKIEPSGIQRY